MIARPYPFVRYVSSLPPSPDGCRLLRQQTSTPGARRLGFVFVARAERGSPINAKIAGRGASESVWLSAVGPWGPSPGVGPTPNVAVSAPGRGQRGTYGGQGKAAGLPTGRRLCCEAANDNSPLPAALDVT